MPQGAPILVVDDDDASRRAVCAGLEEARFECLGLPSGTEALQWVSQNPAPSAIVLDLVMPNLDGFQTLRVLRARPGMRDIPVVVMTSLEGDDEITQAFRPTLGHDGSGSVSISVFQ